MQYKKLATSLPRQKNKTLKLGWPLALYEVSGDSMLPAFKSGDLLVGWCWFSPKLGQVVVVNSDKILIKRLTKVVDGKYFVTGDNPAKSTDSRDFGPVSREQLMAKIVCRVARAG